ncbi:T9SS type A sorting domain-containing protein [Pelobium sp.]|nr:T9SS type A sorting domain-containing protein [Pelobium sp.]MDA9555649.1 T9SS type A sorting domain-containing protein [Pelobium sp.]
MNKLLPILSGLLALTIQATFAQSTKEKEVRTSIIINNTDTIVNGKNFKDISESERVELRKNFTDLDNKPDAKMLSKAGNRNVIIKRLNGENIADSSKIRVFSFDDTLPGKGNIENRIIVRKPNADDIDWKMVHPKRAPIPAMPPLKGNLFEFERPSKPNSSSFNFSTTDKDGFTTRTQIRISEPSTTDLKEVFKNERAEVDGLKIENLVFYPNFSAGTMSMAFNLPKKGNVSVKLIDSSGQTVFTDNKTLTTDSYNKQVTLNKNGIYFLEVIQAGKTFLRKIVKN